MLEIPRSRNQGSAPHLNCTALLPIPAWPIAAQRPSGPDRLADARDRRLSQDHAPRRGMSMILTKAIFITFGIAVGGAGVVARPRPRHHVHEAGVQVVRKRRFKKTTDSDHALPVFDNLLKRGFDVAQPDQVYAADITYIWTQEGWLYLAVVIDLCSRKVVGWSMAPRMKAQLVCDALTMAVWNRRPKDGLIHHSDRGSQYASHAFRKLLAKHSIEGSMSRKGDCWDNAVVESFFGSLKQERVHRRNYQTRYEAQQDILNYITMFYNSIRLHSYLDYQSPNEYEKQLLELKKVA